MKKIKVLLSALAMVAAMAFVSCGGGAGDDPTGGKSGAGAVEDVLVIDCDGYKATYPVEIATGLGYTTVNIEAKWESETGTQAAFQFKNGDTDHSSETINLSKTYEVVSGKFFQGATWTDWDNGGATVDCVDGAKAVQFFIQNANDNYAAVTGKVYIKKLWLSAAGKEDLVIYPVAE